MKPTTLFRTTMKFVGCDWPISMVLPMQGHAPYTAEMQYQMQVHDLVNAEYGHPTSAIFRADSNRLDIYINHEFDIAQFGDDAETLAEVQESITYDGWMTEEDYWFGISPEFYKRRISIVGGRAVGIGGRQSTYPIE